MLSYEDSIFSMRINITSDFYLACFLISNGLIYRGIQHGEVRGRKEFIFEDSSDWNALTKKFKYERPEVRVHEFIAALRRLKSDLHGD